MNQGLLNNNQGFSENVKPGYPNQNNGFPIETSNPYAGGQAYESDNPYAEKPITDGFAPPYPESDNYIDDNQGFAVEANSLKEQKKSSHARCIIGTVMLLAGIALSIVFAEPTVIPFVIAGVYLLYLLICLCFNPFFSYFNNVEHGTYFEQ